MEPENEVEGELRGGSRLCLSRLHGEPGRSRRKPLSLEMQYANYPSYHST
jgi:hypothetical protein